MSEESGENARGRALRGAYLTGADLSGRDLRRADLRGARLAGASLRGADLLGACLRGADLAGTDLSGATLNDADLTGARPDTATRWPDGFDLAAHRARWAAAHPEPPAEEEDGGPASDRKVLRAYFADDGRLVQIPSMRGAGGLKKLHVVLRRLAEEFAVGERYPEREVNARLARFHEDVATLRRNLVDLGYMARENGVYWRLPQADGT
jgi:hypothetical protein